jgi:hypothetical protein
MGLKRVLATVAITVAIAMPGCGLHQWGPTEDQQAFSASREYWEVPVGVIATAPAIAIDVTVSLSATLIVGLLNPINWICWAVGSDGIGPGISLLPCTATALTLANPSCNLDWSWSAPDMVAKVQWHTEDDTEHDDAGK